MIGAGVSGLAAGAELGRLARRDSVDLTLAVFEAGERPGGKLLTADFAGTRVDLGAESLLARGPDTEAVIGQLGLGASLIRPATTSASIWNGRRLVPIPRDTVLGVPLYPWRADVVRAVGVLGAARAALEPVLRRGEPQLDGALGDFVGRRVGNRVFGRLVDPLLGGVYAGPANGLSTGAVAPQLLAAAEKGGSLLQGLRRWSRANPNPAGTTPFVSFPGGLERLVEGLVAAIPHRTLHLGQPVGAIKAVEGGRFRLQVQGAPSSDFDGLVLALSAPAAAVLLSPMASDLGQLLRELEYSSVATITLAYPDQGLSRQLMGSGFLVVRRPRRLITACTFMDRKWPQLRQPGLTILRVSVGSFGDEWALALDDTTLVTSVHRELRTMLGIGKLPIDARVERWHGALPQYRSGHLGWRARVAQSATTLAAPLELTGAAFGGIGVAACIREGTTSAQSLWSRLSPA